ncbi:MAG: hypothetical protein AAGJ34_08380 [Pseudomonadota bacterium]
MTDLRTQDEERLAAWRADRARLADEARAQRLEERQKAREVSELQVELAAEALLRDHGAYSELGKDNEASEKARRQRSYMRAMVCIGGSVACALLWCFGLSAPLYEANTEFVVLSPQSDTAARTNTLFVAQDLTDRNHGGFVATAFITSPTIGAEIGRGDFAETRWQSTLSLPFEEERSPPFRTATLNYQSGLVALSVLDTDPQEAERIAEDIVVATAERINALYSERTHARIADAENRLRLAENNLAQAVERVHILRQQNGDIDPDARLASLYGQIQMLTTERLSTETKLKNLELVEGTATPQATRLRAMIADFDRRIEALRNPNSGEGLSALSEASLAFERARFSISLAEENLAGARSRFEDALKSATLSHGMLQVIVETQVSETAVFPRIAPTLILSVLLGFIAFALLQIARPLRQL